MPYKLIVFDWDGTLYNSAGHIVKCIQQAAQKLNFGKLSEQTILNYIGLSPQEISNRLLPQASQVEQANFIEQFRVYYRETASHQMPILFEGTAEVLSLLKKAGYWLAVATGKSRQYFNNDLLQLEIGDYFLASRCGDETPSKPNPQMLLEIMNELGITPENVLMIGDTEYDIQLANNAGVDALAVTYGVHDRERLLAQAIVGALSDIRELPQWLEQANSQLDT